MSRYLGIREKLSSYFDEIFHGGVLKDVKFNVEEVCRSRLSFTINTKPGSLY